MPQQLCIQNSQKENTFKSVSYLSFMMLFHQNITLIETNTVLDIFGVTCLESRFKTILEACMNQDICQYVNFHYSHCLLW